MAYYQELEFRTVDRLRGCQLNRSAQLGNGVIIKLIGTWLLFASLNRRSRVT